VRFQKRRSEDDDKDDKDDKDRRPSMLSALNAYKEERTTTASCYGQ
jgi:hypothetical protein